MLRALLLRRTGVVAYMVGRSGQRMRRPLQLSDHPLQLAVEAVEVLAQLAEFITPVGIQPPGQVAFAAGDIAHGLHGFLQRAGNAACDDPDHQAHQQRDHHAQQRSVTQLSSELGLYVVHVDARADDPAPGLEQLDEGRLGNRFASPGLGPAVIHRPRPLLARQRSHFVEYRKTIRIPDARQVLAIELGIGRMHDHARGQVVDPEVVVMVIAQRPHHLQGLLLGRVAAQRAGGLQLLEMHQYTCGRFHHMPGFLSLGLVQVAVDLAQHQQTKRQQHGYRHYQDQPQAAADRHRSKRLHCACSICSCFHLHPSTPVAMDPLDQWLSAMCRGVCCLQRHDSAKGFCQHFGGAT